MHLILIYLLGIVLLLIFRLLFLHSFYNDILNWDQSVLESFLRGWRFDNLVICFTLILPVGVEIIKSTFNVQKTKWIKIQSIYLSLLFSAILILSIADLPHFAYFRNRISESSFQWISQPVIVMGMIVSNKLNCILLVLALVGCIILSKLIFKIAAKLSTNSSYKKGTNMVIYSSILIFCLLGMRGGRLHPLRMSDAFYTDNPILNQAGLNAPFTLIKSYSNRIRLMDEKESLLLTKNYLKVENGKNNFHSPIARIEKNENAQVGHYNVVLVLMEGMSADYLGIMGNKLNLTPRLDSLSYKSIFYTNAYSAGIHTNNGIFSSLYGFPALKRVRPMGDIPLRQYSGLPYQLKKIGYKNLFFSTSSKAFDNLEHFIFYNHFDTLIGEQDFPKEEVIGPYGVPDDYMFKQAINTIDNLPKNKPFFATMLTASNHDPYILPSTYNCVNNDVVNCGVSYADWAIGNFVDSVKTKKWYPNTIFIFCADHGRVVNGGPYEMDLSNNHIALLIHSALPSIKPHINSNYVQQIDLYPTIMNYISKNYINNTLGINISANQRSYAYFSADDKIGCIDKDWLYIFRYNGKESLHFRKENNPKDHSQNNLNVLTKMRNYALSQTQTAEWLIRNKYCNPEQ